MSDLDECWRRGKRAERLRDALKAQRWAHEKGDKLEIETIDAYVPKLIRKLRDEAGCDCEIITWMKDGLPDAGGGQEPHARWCSKYEPLEDLRVASDGSVYSVGFQPEEQVRRPVHEWALVDVDGQLSLYRRTASRHREEEWVPRPVHERLLADDEGRLYRRTTPRDVEPNDYVPLVDPRTGQPARQRYFDGEPMPSPADPIGGPRPAGLPRKRPFPYPEALPRLERPWFNRGADRL
jgi:hypothetical protein